MNGFDILAESVCVCNVNGFDGVVISLGRKPYQDIVLCYLKSYIYIDRYAGIGYIDMCCAY